MLRNLSGLQGYTIGAADDELGKVRDFFFDDTYWVVRYIVVDTGGWLRDRRVLLSPQAVYRADWANKTLHVELTARQVENSPRIEADRPVSKKVEAELVKYFNWPAYWDVQNLPPEGAKEIERQVTKEPRGLDDSDLRSTEEVSGYSIAALDGSIGHVEDFIIDDGGWGIRYMAVDTRNWLPGRKVLVAPQWIDRVSWAERQVYVYLSQAAVKNSPEYDPSAPVNRQYEAKLYDYYGRPKYWV
jgi:hypothetical protein